MSATNLSARALQLSGDRVPYVHATVVRAVAPTSARAGDTALVHTDGRLEGFVGGVCAESTVRLYSLRALHSGEALLLRIVPDELPGGGEAGATPVDGAVTVANPCLSGGAIEVFLEPRVPAPRLLVEGETPIGRALAELGRPLGFLVETFDGDVAPPAADDAGAVAASHGRGEAPLLEAALRAGVPYVALVASRRRGADVLSGLDVDDEQRARVRTPAGLWIGARTPAEIALSIYAELIAVRANVDVSATADGSSSAIGDSQGGAAPGASSGGDFAGAGRGTAAAAGRPDPTTRGVATAIDPICGMTVAAVPDSLHVVNADGTTSYFCGQGCLAAYTARA